MVQEQVQLYMIIVKTEARGLKTTLKLCLKQSFEKEEDIVPKLTGTIQGKKGRNPNRVILDGVAMKKFYNQSYNYNLEWRRNGKKT